MKIGNTTIINIKPDKVDKQALSNVYDILNEINHRVQPKRNDLFYTNEQVEELKKDSTNIYI